MDARALPFVLPLFLFMLFLGIEGYFPNQHYLLYPIVTLLVAATIGGYWHSYPSLRPAAPLLSIAVGIIGIILWIGLDPWSIKFNTILEELFNRGVTLVGLSSWQMEVERGTPAGLDPFQLYPSAEAWMLFAFRLAGITICVPIMEELFWRGFLMRWLIQEDFTSVPLGAYQPFSFWVTTACFAMVHGSEWLLAVGVGILYGAWFIRTKSLGSVMLAHGSTNLLLALYCLITNDWHFLCIRAQNPTSGG